MLIDCKNKGEINNLKVQLEPEVEELIFTKLADELQIKKEKLQSYWVNAFPKGSY